MIAKEYQNLQLRDLSISSKSIDYDRLDIYKPIGTLTLTDLSWCLRRRDYLEPVVAIVLDKIEENADAINRYFTISICEWYDEVIKEIITIPFDFWDNKHALFCRYRDTIIKFDKRELPIEEAVVQLFLNYKPKPIYWTIKDSEEFDYYICFELLGNFLHAERMIIKLKYALLNGQSVFIENEFKHITTVAQLVDFIKEEYGSIDDYFEDYMTLLLEDIEKIKNVEFTSQVQVKQN